MPKVYSIDLRQRVINKLATNMSCRKVAKLFEVSPSFVCRLQQRWRCTGTVTPAKSGGDRRSRLTQYKEDVCAMIESKNDITLKEIQAQLKEKFQIQVHISIIDRFIRNKIAYRYKKKP